MKRFLATPLFFVLAALAFVGCNDDNDGPQIRTIGFEQAALGTDGFIWGKDHATEQDDTDWQGQPMKSNLSTVRSTRRKRRSFIPIIRITAIHTMCGTVS